jgi:formylglycine-generating enzyme required for sulfatase activity
MTTDRSTAEKRRLRIFLCHAHEDQEAVLQLYQRLQADGFQLWMDKEDLKSGQDWRVEIPRAVRESEVVIVCLSATAVKKAGFEQKEITLALDTADAQPEDAIFIIPLKLEPCDVPTRLGDYHWCEYYQPDGYERLIDALQTRATELGMSPDEWKHRQPQPRGSMTTATLPNLRKIPPAFLAAGMVMLALLGVLLWRFWNGDFAPVAVPTTTSINPLFPVTTEEWRNELQRRGTEITNAGDHYWRYIPAGIYRIGGWTDDWDDENDAEAILELSTYWLAKHPVTVQQYRQFIAAGGYDNRDYWTDNGWEWKEADDDGNGRSQPRAWDDTDFTSDNQPVVGVTWYEATAFANWMHSQLADELPQGYRIRLPTEAQWEVACAYDPNGNHRRTYPWGEQEPTRKLADFNDGNHPMYAAPVGKRPAGASAAGVQDMVGSVWKIMANSHDGYAAESGSVVQDFAPDAFDAVWRGGSWYIEIPKNVRCATRFRNNPHLDIGNFGFFLVLSP